jgi:hypothetical protein
MGVSRTSSIGVDKEAMVFSNSDRVFFSGFDGGTISGEFCCMTDGGG